MPLIRKAAEAPADLSAPTPPAPQSLASSATTASLTWTHASAPAGTVYALAVTDESGASVTPDSGSGLGPYVIPVASGKAYSARLRATGTDGQTAQSSALVQVAAAASGSLGWVVSFDGDFAGVTPATITTATTTTLSGGDFDGVSIKSSIISGNGGSIDVATDGVTAIGGSTSGSMEFDLNLSALFLPSDSADFVVVLIFEGIDGVTGSSRGLRAGISAAGTLSTGVNDGMRAQYSGVGPEWTPNISVNDSTTTSYAGDEAVPVAGRLLIRVTDGRYIRSAWAPGTTDLPDSAAIDGAVNHQGTLAAKMSPRYGAALWVGINAIWTSEARLSRVVIYEQGVV